MPPRRRAVPAPPPLDLAALRERLSAGSVVRVGLAPSAQFPDGGSGRVRTIGDPATDGDEFLQVEVTVNGARDVLPFAPGDLRPVTRAARSARKVPDLVSVPGTGPGSPPQDVRAGRNGSAAAHLASRSGLAGDARTGLGSAGASHTMFFEAQAPAMDSALALDVTPALDVVPPTPAEVPPSPVVNLAAAPIGEAAAPVALDARATEPPTIPTVPTAQPAAKPARRRSTRRAAVAAKTGDGNASPAAEPAADQPVLSAAVSAEPAAPARPRGRAARAASTPPATPVAALSGAGGETTATPRRGGRLPSVSITVSTTAEEPTQWRIDAKVGAKAVVRSEAVSAARVWDMVEGMQTPALTAAVGALLDEHRRLTQARAAALAAELAGVQAELASLPAQPGR